MKKHLHETISKLFSALFLLLLPVPLLCQTGQSYELVVTNVTVIDMTGAGALTARPRMLFPVSARTTSLRYSSKRA